MQVKSIIAKTIKGLNKRDMMDMFEGKSSGFTLGAAPRPHSMNDKLMLNGGVLFAPRLANKQKSKSLIITDNDEKRAHGEDAELQQISIEGEGDGSAC